MIQTGEEWEAVVWSLPAMAVAAPRHTITGYGPRAHTSDGCVALLFLAGFSV